MSTVLGWTGRLAALLLLGTAFFLSLAQAHESRPAYLEIKETAPGQYSVLWRTPVLAGMRLPVVLQLPADVRNLREPLVQELSDSVIERRLLDTGPNGLAGKRIEFPGLQFTITDVLVRTQGLDGTHSTELVRPGRPWIEFAAPRSTAATAGVFLAQGVEHILFGVDHLLFVLGLLLLVRSPWMLVKTITAFTIAHSITLALATLGIVNVPRPPLEAAIALSILFLGVEVVRAWRGESSFTIRNPWVARFRICKRSGHDWPAAGRHPARAADVQSGRGGRTTRVCRRDDPAVESDPQAHAELAAGRAAATRVPGRYARRLLDDRARGADGQRMKSMSCARTALAHQTQQPRAVDRVPAGSGVQFAEQVLQVPFHGLVADIHRPCDQLVR